MSTAAVIKALDAIARALQGPGADDPAVRAALSAAMDVVEESVGEFTRSFVEALVIVLAVSFLSLGWRSGLVVALSVPLVLAATVVVMNAHLWHAGTANRTAFPRTDLHAFYCRRDKPQQEDQKRLLRPEVQQCLSAPLRHLLALDDPSADEVHAQAVARSGFLK